MRKIFFALFLTIAAAAAAAVHAQTAPPVTVVRHEWKPETQSRMAADAEPLTDLPVDEGSPSLRRNPTATLIRNPDGTSSINPDSTRVNPNGAPEPAGSVRAAARRSIRAALEIKNDAARPIAAVEADFVFYDRDKKEYLRYRFAADKSVKPGEKAKIKKEVTEKDFKNFSGKVQPAVIFDVAPVETKIEIVSVKYADGTVWTAPSAAARGAR